MCEDTVDGEGWRQDFRAVLSDIRAALGTARIAQAEFTHGHESILWHDAGDIAGDLMLPEDGPTAVGLWREYWRDHHTILLHHSGQLYHLQLRRRGSLKQLSSTSSSSSSSVPAVPVPAVVRPSAHLLNLLEPDGEPEVRDGDETAVDADAERSSGEPRPAEQQ